MVDQWFSETGAEGTLSLHHDEDGWIVAPSETEKTVRCNLLGNHELSPENSPHSVSGTVSKYMIGTGNRPDYLHFRYGSQTSSSTTQRNSQTNTPDQGTESTDSLNIREQSNYPYRELDEINGTGDFVSVVARLEHIYWVKKGEPGTPDLKGRLTDESISYGVAFVIGEDVTHPYLDKDMWFLFDNVRDYHWEPEDQTTIWISDQTEFTELQPVSSSTPSSSSTDPSASSNSSSRQQSASSLADIATDKIGSTTFTISQEDRDSAVGKAKRKAKDQQRDPAIDPEFQYNSDIDE